MQKVKSKIKKLEKLFGEKGQIALITVLVLLSATTILVVAISALTFNEIKKLNNIVRSSQSYYVAEAGVEDAIIRAQNRTLPCSVPCTYTLSYGLPGSADVSVTGTTDEPVITSKGDVDSRIRKVQVGLKSTTNATSVAFNYGVQVGYGGLVMSNNAGIIGNVYSNGNITGSNGSFVTGTAIAANSPSLTADQVNDAPIPSSPVNCPPTANPLPNCITFGNASGTQDAAQSFQVSTNGLVNKVDLYIKKVSTPGNLTVRVTNSSSGNPGSTTLASATLNASSVTTNFGWVSVSFSSNPLLVTGVPYWLVLDGGTSSSKYYVWAANASYSSGEAKTGQYSAGPWAATSLDGYFKLYLGGMTGTIDNVRIGDAVQHIGDGWAHTVDNSTIYGVKYCTTTNNSPACNTSKGDPAPASFPISQANIDQWKAEAEAGGTTTGDFNLTNFATASLGPRKITGNMNLSNGAVLTVTGTVWVQGHINLANNVQIRLDPGYGANGGVLVADGWVSISNNTQFYGSGQAGSYVLLLSTNDCNGTGSPTGQACTGSNSAIDVANNAGTVIIYAANGQVEVANNAGAKEITGYKLSLSNNATVTYESGLANANFSSGPGGGYEILRWVEIE